MALLSLGVLAWPASAQDLGEEWEALTAEDAAIRFTAPGLEQHIVRHLRLKNVDNTYSHEYAFWTGPAAREPKAVVHYIRAFSGLSFRSDRDPKYLIRKLGLVEGKQVSIQSLQKDQNSQGRIRYRRFSVGDLDCAGFTQSWGMVEWGSGDKMLFGFYCADPGQTLSDEALDKIVHAVTIKRSAQ